MTIEVVVTVKCDKCSKTVVGNGKIADAYAKAKKAGWGWPNASTQLCPDHKAKKVAKPVAKRAVTKKAKAAKKGQKPSTYMGQAVKLKKVEPAAEAVTG